MKKIVRLTESDLVRIVKRVISEQTKDGPVAIPKNAEIKIDDSVIQDAKKLGITFNQDEKSVDVLYSFLSWGKIDKERSRPAPHLALRCESDNATGCAHRSPGRRRHNAEP